MRRPAYIVRDDPEAAARIVERIVTSVEGLGAHPASGRPGRVPGTRELVVSGTPYLVPYRVRFVSSAGDSVLAEFASVVNAVQCAVEIQTTLKAENANLPPERRMEFRIGVNLGDVMVDGEQIYVDGVNVAAPISSTRFIAAGLCSDVSAH